MNNYHPNRWIIVQIKGDDPHYRVFGSWSGGYLDGDSWRMNSGITEVHETDTTYNFMGSSGSTYFCNKESYGLTLYSAGVLAQYEKKLKGKFAPLYDKPDVMSLKFLGAED